MYRGKGNVHFFQLESDSLSFSWSCQEHFSESSAHGSVPARGDSGAQDNSTDNLTNLPGRASPHSPAETLAAALSAPLSEEESGSCGKLCSKAGWSWSSLSLTELTPILFVFLPFFSSLCCRCPGRRNACVAVYVWCWWPNQRFWLPLELSPSGGHSTQAQGLSQGYK